jgi:hypothetical protein
LREGKLGLGENHVDRKQRFDAPRENKNVGEQVIGCERETATLFLGYVVCFSRHVNAAVRLLSVSDV